jgi:hypothetical protein
LQERPAESPRDPPTGNGNRGRGRGKEN